LDSADPANPKPTIDTLSGLLGWYRDSIDEELIAAWKKDTRANLPEVMKALATPRVAWAEVEFSWRERGQGALNPAYAPMFVNLMTRFPESAQPFLDGLLATPPPDLSRTEAEAACRILLDMPDIGTWRKRALEILPHYRRVAENLLAQDVASSDREKSYRARVWLADLKTDVPGASDQPGPRRRPAASPRLDGNDGARRSAVNDSIPNGDQTPPPSTSRAPSAANNAPARPTLSAYNGARSGTLESSGGPIPQNAEFVFRNLPLGKMQLDYDTKTWDARLAPGDGQTQKLIVRNKSSGPQKHCVVRWTVIP